MPLGVLLQLLNDRSRFKTPLEVELDELGCIRARHFTFDGDYAFGSTIHHEGQAIDRGVSWPTEQDYYRIALPDEDLPYEALKSIVQDAKDDDPDDLPWIEYDEHGNAIPGSETKERLLAWLQRPVEDDRLDSWGDCRISEYGIGIEIYEALSDEERYQIGLVLGDFGTISIAMQAQLEGSAESFNLLMGQKGIPVVLRSDAM